MSSAAQPTALVRIDPARVPIALSVFGQERLALLKEQIGRGWPEPMSDAELEHIGLVCQRTRLDPLVKPAQIYFIKRKDTRLGRYVMTPQVSIDGLRLIAQRSRDYGGATPYLYCGTDGVWTDVWLDEEHYPAAAKCGVKRRGWKDYLYAVATWKEWAQWEAVWETGPDNQRRPTSRRKPAQFWEKMPAHMLGKTAEALALKRAFPEETNELELAAIDQEYREQQVLNAQRYTEIFPSEEERDREGIPPGRALHDGRTVDTQTGEVLDELEPDPPGQPEEDQDQAYRCVTCKRPIIDQMGNAINDNQRDLLLQRFGRLECRECRAL